MRRDVLPAVPKELQDYVTGKLEPLLRANVVAGLLTSLMSNGYIHTKGLITHVNLSITELQR